MNETARMVSYYIIALSLLMYVIAAPRQNKTQATNAPRHNNSRAHKLANSNHTKTSVTQHNIQNSKKTNIPPPEELLGDALDLFLSIFGILNEFQETVEGFFGGD